MVIQLLVRLIPTPRCRLPYELESFSASRVPRLVIVIPKEVVRLTR